jgi:drug/metabolite transporter (DMT)-like permease
MNIQDQDGGAHKKRYRRFYNYWQLALLIIIVLIFSILNNLSASMMGYVMPGFPSWLLYATTFMYITIFLVTALLRKEKPFSRENLTKTHLKHYFLLGIATILNGITFQFSAPWVDGDLSQILTNLGVPIVAFISVWWLKHHYTKLEWTGTVIVCFGIVIGLVRPIKDMITGGIHSQAEKSDLPWWMLCFAFSAIVQDIEQILQERAFNDSCLPATTLFWYNLISLPAYLLVIPFESVKYLNGKTHWVEPSQAFANQWHAFRCAFGFPYHEDKIGETPACQDYAWLWPNLFVIGYAGMFFFNAIVIRDMDALYAVIISAIVPPIVGAIFSQKAIVGSAHTTPFTWFVGVSFALVFIGIIVKAFQKKKEEIKIIGETQPVLSPEDENEYLGEDYGSEEESSEV